MPQQQAEFKSNCAIFSFGWLIVGAGYLFAAEPDHFRHEKLAILLLLFLPVTVRGQGEGDILVVKEIRNGAVCESCLMQAAGCIALNPKQVSFLTPNHDSQFLYKDSALTQSFTTLRLHRYFIAVQNFSLDFYPYSFKRIPQKGYSLIYWDFQKFQFKTSINGIIKNDWTDIGSLTKDPDFYIGYTTTDFASDHSENVRTRPAEHYHAGKFNLRINDSLRVEVRDKNTLKDVYSFTVTRVRSVPDHFNFVEFSSEKSFEEILNTEISKPRSDQGSPPSRFEIKGGHSAFLRFNYDEQYYFFGRMPRNSGIEYAMDKPENWKQLGGEKGQKFVNGYTYIYLDEPKPGKTVKIFLRYKHQPETVHEVTVNVTRLRAGWVDVALPVLGVLVVALLAIFIQKKHYKRQLIKINNKKNEIENQLQLLTGQLNPHFLFNSLNAVQSLIRQNDPEAANQYITEVATFMRTIMDNGRRELVSLAEEIGIEEKYIALEQKRKAFTYTFRNECGNDIASIDFPPLLLQPVIENCIRHGLVENVRNPTLSITIRCDATDLIVVIADNGIGFDTSIKMPGHGLSLTAKRVALFNEKLPTMQIVLQTKSGQGSGTATEIRLLKWLS